MPCRSLPRPLARAPRPSATRLGLAPTLILTIEGAGPKQAMSVIESAKIPMVIVPDPYSGEGIIERRASRTQHNDPLLFEERRKQNIKRG